MNPSVSWRYVNQAILSLTLLVAYMGACYLTMPSIFTPIALPDSLLTILVSTLVTLTGLSLCIPIFWIADVILSTLVRSKRKIFLPLLPCLIYASLVLVLLDNSLSITVNFRIFEQPRSYAILYLAVFICVTGLVFMRMGDEVPSGFTPLFILAASCTITLAITGLTYSSRNSFPRHESPSVARPDIFLLGIDGVTIEDTSLLHSSPDTTPFLRALSEESLVFENAYAEGNNTANSLMAIWTSLSPFESGLVGYPQLANDTQSRQHLFTLLEQAGYRSSQHAIRRYGDAFDGNLRGGIEGANGRSLALWNSSFFRSFPRFHSSLEFNFLLTAYEDIIRIVGTALFLIPSEHSMQHFSIPVHSWGFRDPIALEQARGVVTHMESPIFLHLHLSGTHGPFFDPRVLSFSDGTTQSERNQEPSYRDAILTADQDLAAFLDYLKSMGRYENSLVIIYSDHDLSHQLNARVPLLLKLPYSKQRGRVIEPVALSDVSATIVEQLGLDRPSWMRGTSLTAKTLNSSRVLYTAGASDVAVRPSVGSAGAIYCGNKIEYVANDADCSITYSASVASCPNVQPTLTKLCSELQERLRKLRSAPSQRAFLLESWGDG